MSDKMSDKMIKKTSEMERSRARPAAWFRERVDLRPWLRPILEKEVKPHEASWMHCWGGITFTLILTVFASGALLAVYYRPTPEEAFGSVVTITDQVRLGWLVRGVHHWAAGLIVVAMAIHGLRVFYAGAYRKPRELTWVAGVLLAMLVLGSLFTGYLLTWSQQGYWATRIGMGLAGEIPVVGEPLLLFLQGGYVVKGFTLSRFFAAHVLFLPGGICLLLVAHFVMVRLHGISEPI